MKALRQEFADTMLEVGLRDQRLVVMVGDISHGILQDFARACPGRYYNIGICEQLIVNMAAGLSKVGLVPVVHTIAPFIIERAYEQIKLDFGYQKLPINLISVGNAFDYSQLGCSHHCYTDISILAHFKRAQIVFPGGAVELNVLFNEIYAQDKINYFRLPQVPHGVEFSKDDVHFGKGIKVREGQDITIVCIGTQLRTALDAAQSLKSRNVSAEVLYYHTIKPFDEDLVRASLAKTKRVLTVEEASSHDGLFNLVLRASRHLDGVRYAQLAIEDFVHAYGTYEELCSLSGFSVAGITEIIRTNFPEIGSRSNG